ncbi:RNA polymerase sigma factor [Kutzneria buriramensis]|uniref:RNA polymerase sigma-70 factor (ECF subfamily) n=1 Tax=Kutzneria buriramensis TaxID=1045776 RepID=A0A3E0H0L4_9PSEU|nr:RNA polymerase sigma factor [Kutzneria buriramensis]REH35374.1 RNA polymerase sigma-70 factor (ECF subfamily) [Kutzneria buriramensis]
MTGLRDAAELVELYDNQARSLHRYLAVRVDVQVADDLVHEAFLTAWERRADFDPSRAGLKAWVYGIATNLLRQHVRTEGRRLRALAREHGRRVVTDRVDERMAAVIDAETLAADLAETLAELRPEERDVLLLVAWADLTPAEIAEVTDTPVATVRTRLFRARARLRARMGGLEGDGDA